MDYGEIVRQIVSQSEVVGANARRELEKELRTHFEDAIEEARSGPEDEAAILQAVCNRFGDPKEIARDLADVHRFDRRVSLTCETLAWLGLAMIGVTGLILGLQLTVAVWRSTPVASAFPQLPHAFAGLGALVLGYMGLYLEVQLFRNHALIKALALNMTIFLVLFGLSFVGLHLTSMAPILAFVSGAAVRVIQQTTIRSAWFLGTAVPISLWSITGTRWQAALVQWIGLTSACYVMTVMARWHRRAIADH